MDKPAQPKVAIRPCLVRSGLVILSCASVVFGGCGARKRPTLLWSTAILSRPTSAPRVAAASDPAEDPVPELQLEPPAFPLRLISTRSAPTRPRAAGQASNGGSSDPEKIEPPSPPIAPSLSAQETANDQQQINESLSIAEKNLAASHGRKLNAAQLDLASKIQSFIKGAREAAQLADWTRARGLAKKAEVLSEELAGSL